MSLYSKIRERLSKSNKGRLSKFLILSGLKPKVNRKADSHFEKGIVVFSADFEMAWAFRFSKTKQKEAVEKGLAERNNMPILLDLFDKYKIPVTWATVGHLFLEKCYRTGTGLPHPEMPRPPFFENRNWSFKSGDWYSNDPCTDTLSDPAWYASDLIDQILGSKADHEIGCHTFSHIDFTYRNCPKLLADAELDACIKLAVDKSIRLKSIVFPGGTFGNFESLKERGIICYRKPMKHHIEIPYIDSHGLVVIPSSLGLDKDPYGWSKVFHLMMICNYLEKAAKHRLVCHFWFHPSMDKWYLENVMPEVLRMVADYRNSNKIQIKTMGKLAEEVIGNQ
jgi:peptidoglycan/xylan/chitin deacetylase (PgdA/CDA1 family)